MLVDRYFFETLIRIHRAGEGEGFNGLKPAGSVDPAIAAADQALASGNIDAFADEFAAAIHQAIKERFGHAREQLSESSFPLEPHRAEITDRRVPAF